MAELSQHNNVLKVPLSKASRDQVTSSQEFTKEFLELKVDAHKNQNPPLTQRDNAKRGLDASLNLPL